ncbi:unnamed protein product [Euphydryas editha]|uniref:Voltage-dependent anion-selective channel protein 3 n=1 Tax=Euphydryas editha TaxID=104508 RepID=A0AAU9U1S0_EUPED|nr:unnamed protein product [Euphydryas editha]
MAPPYYADLGKKASDVFSKGYHFGVFKLDLKTKSESGVEFSSGITSNQESGKVFGSLSSKYAVKDYGLTFTEKWNTDNTLATDITIQDKIAAGLKVTLEGTFAPQTGSKTGKLKTSFSNDTVAVNTNLDLDLAGPIVDVAAVLKYQGWLAGAHTQFDTQKAKFSKNNFAFGYQTNDFALHTNVQDVNSLLNSLENGTISNLDEESDDEIVQPIPGKIVRVGSNITQPTEREIADHSEKEEDSVEEKEPTYGSSSKLKNDIIWRKHLQLESPQLILSPPSSEIDSPLA